MSQVIGVWVCLHAAATFSVEKVLTMLQEGTHKNWPGTGKPRRSVNL